MNGDKLEFAAALAVNAGPVYIATADASGKPHVAAAGRLALAGDDRIELTEWFCPQTLANLAENGFISTVIWDEYSDTGFQILGRIEAVKEIGVLDGYAPKLENELPLPQIERRLLIAVDKIIDFKLGPHSDIEE